MVDRSFSWLGRFPLAVDLADTVRIVGDENVELLTDEAALTRWIEAERARFPGATAANCNLESVIRLRDAVRSVLVAGVHDKPLPADDVGFLNEASARCPSFPELSADGSTSTVETNADPYDVFAAAVARSTMETLAETGESISECTAPGCGMLFAKDNPRQRWCSRPVAIAPASPATPPRRRPEEPEQQPPSIAPESPPASDTDRCCRAGTPRQ